MKSWASKKTCVLLIILAIAMAAVLFSYIFTISSQKIRNVILISIDTCRADHLSCYGFKQNTTPNIDALAKEGILFENVISPVPITLPAHSSMMTGTIPPYHGVHDNGRYVLHDSNVTLAEILKENGFITGAIISAFVLDSRFGMDQGFDSYDDDFDEALRSSSVLERKAEEVNKHAYKWLSEHKDEKFFLFLHYFEPHHAYDPPEPYASRFKNDPYSGEIAYTDYRIGQIIKKLKDMDIYDSTMIVITADHGEDLGDHGEGTHSYFIYQSTIRVPLIFKLGGKSAGKRVADNVGLIDIFPTICSALDINVPKSVAGRDLSMYFSGGDEPSEPRDFYCETFVPTHYKCSPLLGLVRGNFKYIQTSKPELYDLKNDAGETHNLIKEQFHRALIMQDALKQMIETHTDDEGKRGQTEVDSKTNAILESLGYISTGRLDESFEFDTGKPDAKDYIKAHRMCISAGYHLAQKQYDEVRQICAKLIELKPELARTYYYLGNAALATKDYSKAVKYYSRCVKLDRKAQRVCNNLGYAYNQLGRVDESINSFAKALELNPDSMEAHFNIGSQYAKKASLDRAVNHLQRAYELDPEDADIKNELKRVLDLQARRSSLIESLKDAVDSNPDSLKAHFLLAQIYLNEKNFESAVPHFYEAVRIKPDFLEARNHLARILIKQKRPCEALQQFYEILKVKPDSPDILNRSAWILSTTADASIQDPAKAVEFAHRACKLTNYVQAEVVDTLAVAYAANGQFDKSIKTAQKAIKIAESKENTELAERIQARLELYRAGKTYLDPDLKN